MTNEPRETQASEREARAEADKPLPSDPPAGAPRPPQFSPFVDVLAALILLAGIATIVSLSWSVPPLERIPHPDRALALIVSKSMDLEEALEDVSDWERLLFEAISGDAGGLDDAIGWYEELANHSNGDAIELQLAILEGEAGEVPALQTRLGLWDDRREPFPLYTRLIEAAYLDQRLADGEAFRLQAELAEVLRAGWFYDRLAIRLAERVENRELLRATQAAADLRQDELLARARGFLLVELLIVGAGITILILVFKSGRRDASVFWIGEAAIPPRWSARAGILVMLRGGAAGVLVIIGFILLGMEEGPSRLVMVPLINFPLLWLAHHHLFRPNGFGFADSLGLRPIPGRWGPMVLAVAVLAGAGLVVDWVIALIAEPLGLSLHWTEWFDPELVWGGGVEMGLTLLEYLLFAPIFEELVFRGILFGTLRRRFSFFPAAVISASVFALAHGYGLLGLISVCASGVIWAWGYERTRSLLPGVLAHFLNNMLVCSGLLLMLR